MTAVSLPSKSLPGSYFCAPHRSIMWVFFSFCVWWECFSYRCLNVLRVHAYILEILIFASLVRNRISVHHGAVCAGRPWEQSSPCQWSLPALCCPCHTDGTACPAVSLHQSFPGQPCVHCSLNIPLPIPLQAAQLVQTGSPAEPRAQPSPLCTARALRALFCSYSFGIKLTQAVKEKLCCPVYTNQWRDLHLSQD